MNNNMYHFYLNSGKAVSVLGCMSNRQDTYTTIYKEIESGREKGKVCTVARFEHANIAGFIIEEVKADDR